MAKLRGKAKQDFLDRMEKGRKKAARNPTKRKIVAKKKPALKRKTNPAPNKTKQINGAVDLYRRFTGMEPKYVDRIKVNPPKVGMIIGKCDGVLYTTKRDGKTEQYIHRFDGRSRPTLCASWDGKEIFFVEGAYNFTEDGIVDK